jgi:hypothetical protein
MSVSVSALSLILCHKPHLLLLLLLLAVSHLLLCACGHAAQQLLPLQPLDTQHS